MMSRVRPVTPSFTRSVFTAKVPSLLIYEAALIEQVIELDGDAFAVRLGDTEADRSKGRREERGVQRLLQRLGQHALVDHVLDGEQPRDVGLGLFERAVGVLQLLPDRRLRATDRDVVRPEPVHQLVDENVREERFERQVALIAGGRTTFEIGRSVFANFASCTFFSITRLVPFSRTTRSSFGQVERRGLNAAVAVARGVDLVDHDDRRQRAQLRVALLRIDRQVVLDVLQLAGESLQLGGLGLVAAP